MSAIAADAAARHGVPGTHCGAEAQRHGSVAPTKPSSDQVARTIERDVAGSVQPALPAVAGSSSAGAAVDIRRRRRTPGERLGAA